MWIFLNKAYLSIVRHRTEPNRLLVRARNEGDIEAVFPSAVVQVTPEGDYLYRAAIHESIVAAAIKYQLLDLEYPNFKNSIPEANHEYHNACMDVWTIMNRYQKDGVHNGKKKKD